MTELHWSTTRDEAIEAFNGETPGAQLEQDIIAHFVDDPERVQRAIQRVAAQEGINSRWAVLRADLNRTHTADVKADATKGKLKAIERAKQWIDNAGLHYDHERHVKAELFGDDYTKGRLQDLKLSAAEKQQLVDYYHQARPRGAQAEQDAEQWMADCKTKRLEP